MLDVHDSVCLCLGLRDSLGHFHDTIVYHNTVVVLVNLRKTTISA